MKHLLKTILLLSVVAAAASCSSEDEYFDSFHFNELGGPLNYYDFDLDGSTLVIESDGRTSRTEYYPKSEYNPDDYEQWHTETDWLRASYTPSMKWLFIFADSKTGKGRREAVVYGYFNGKKKAIKVKQ